MYNIGLLLLILKSCLCLMSVLFTIYLFSGNRIITLKLNISFYCMHEFFIININIIAPLHRYYCPIPILILFYCIRWFYWWRPDSI